MGVLQLPAFVVGRHGAGMNDPTPRPPRAVENCAANNCAVDNRAAENPTAEDSAFETSGLEKPASGSSGGPETPQGLPGRRPTKNRPRLSATRRAEQGAPAAPSPGGLGELVGRASRKGRAHLLLGPVGAGKSTRGLELAREHRAVRLTLDEWMATLFRPDRPDEGVVPWYVERAARAVDQIWAVARDITAVGADVVLELGLLRRSERQRFFAQVRAAEVPLRIHVVDAPRDVRRERVEARNRLGGPTFTGVVPLAWFELASDFWEPLTPDEWPEKDVQHMWTAG
jgi:predicted kinase